MGGGILIRLAKDRRGVAAVEFAFIAPVLILFYFSIAEFTQAMLAKRRANAVASTVGDLVARDTSITNSEISDTFTVSATLMAPFPTGTLKMRITAITANASGTAKVVWSDGYNGLTALPVNQTVSVPAGVIAANQSVIMSEVQYQHTSTMHYVVPANMNFSQTYYLRPRLSDQVARTP